MWVNLSQKSTAGTFLSFFMDRQMLNIVSRASDVAIDGFIMVNMMSTRAEEKM
jgi:hypothetical protein